MPAIRAIRTKADILSLDLEWQASEAPFAGRVISNAYILAAM